MTNDHDTGNDPDTRQDRADRQVDQSGTAVQALVILSTTMTTALGGIYMTTRSIVVTALTASLIALLGVCVTLRCVTKR